MLHHIPGWGPGWMGNLSRLVTKSQILGFWEALLGMARTLQLPPLHICSDSRADISIGCQCSPGKPLLPPQVQSSWTASAGLVRDVSGLGQVLRGVPNRLLEVPGQPCPGVVRGCSLTPRGLSHDATAWKSIVNVQGPHAVRGAHACWTCH